MKTLTIRQIPDEVAAFLTAQADESGKSVNRLVVSVLSREAGLDKPARRRDLSWLAGSWTPMEAKQIDKATAECRTLHAEDWK